ncbi:L-lactate dehydrogenase [Ilyonectria sp. MPI-CAGE-AT-0026]|nr:L-lactate dehydrogenase [Ilyonectria sp. MPI-CAGE-AT-0026]
MTPGFGASTSQSAASPLLPPGAILPLSACKSLDDLEEASRALLSPKAAVYFDSGAETLSARDRNRSDWTRIGFRPRVLRNVATASMKCRIMGSDSSMPVFIAPAAAARLGHKDGELCLASGAAQMDIPQCVCTYSSVSPGDVMEFFQSAPGRRGGALFFQLYMPKVKQDATKLIDMAKKAGFSALVVTVDSPVIGKRDDDDRFKALLDLEAGLDEERTGGQLSLPGNEAETLRGVHCSTLEWDDLPWIRECWGERPIILKGIQTVEDALEATRHGVDGIYLSNHGGRQLDYAPSPVQVLLEIRKKCPEIFYKTDVYVDGGIMRGTDVVKALCLGARAVGIGRGFLYALSAYGAEGVLKAIQILSDEIQTTMRLLGVTTISQLNSEYINLDEFEHHCSTRAGLSKI